MGLLKVSGNNCNIKYGYTNGFNNDDPKEWPWSVMLGTCKDLRGSRYDQKHRILKAYGAAQLTNTEKLD